MFLICYLATGYVAYATAAIPRAATCLPAAPIAARRDARGGFTMIMATAFQVSPLAQPGGHVIGVEEALRGPIVAGVPDVLGRVDLLVASADELILTDLKTSRSRWSVDQVEDAGQQLLLYSDLVQQLAPGKQLRLRFGVITKAKEPAVELHEVEPDPQRIARTKRVLARVWRAIAAGHFYPSPSPLACGSCPYREPCCE